MSRPAPKKLPTSIELEEAGIVSGETYVSMFAYGGKLYVALPIDFLSRRTRFVTCAASGNRCKRETLISSFRRGAATPVALGVFEGPLSYWIPATDAPMPSIVE